MGLKEEILNQNQQCEVLSLSKHQIITDPSKLIFAMDIGTRSVVGIVCYPENDKLRVLTSEIAFHRERDMFDGQIQNIEGVVKTSREVKEKLEKRLGIPLERVAIAAAGRALKTCRYLLEKEFPQKQKIRREEIASLQLEAVEKARQTLFDEETAATADRYYCVGYTTVAYFLDKYPITSLIGQRGNKMGIEVLATFLPQVVIDSLLTVVEKLELAVHNLTLEPIAALNVTIPHEYRSLNLALVDVGAGTTDIAITHKGTVSGYAMVPLAGDEISEHLAETYLLDFKAAEAVKLKLAQKKANISFKDILGNNYHLPAQEILTALEPAIEKLASKITSTITEYNDGPPRAVFLIGGGSQTPFLKEKIAEKLELPPKMVVIRGREVVQKIAYTGRKLKGPESITPFGIAVAALQKNYFGFSYLTVNEKVVRLLDIENLKVGNVLIAAGFSSQKMLGRRGPGIKILLNGEDKFFPGNAGESAIIRVNEELASLETIVKNNDKITVQEAKDGSPLELKILDVLPMQNSQVFLNEQPCPPPLSIYLNGRKAESATLLKNGDRLEWQFGNLETFLEMMEQETKSPGWKINGLEAGLGQMLKPGDKITAKFPEEKEKIEETFVEEKIFMLTIHVNDKPISIPAEPAPSFVKIFDYIDFDRSKPRGKLVMIHNGKPASLTGKLHSGDQIAVFWESES
jgi:cell division protein FtsA